MNYNPIIEKIHQQITTILGTKEWDLKVKETHTSFSEKLNTGTYELLLYGPAVPATIASFQLVPMINCCGICVSTQASVNINYQHRGLGTLLNQTRIDIARYLGYGLLLCTDVENNLPQRKILEANGWKDVYKFINPRTKRNIFISVINL